MTKNLYQTCFEFPLQEIDPVSIRLNHHQNVVDGIIKKVAVYEEFDPRIELGKYSSYDFCLDNLIAIGATDILKQNYRSSVSDFNVADQFENFSIQQSQNPE